MTADNTTITITTETRDRIKAVGEMGDDYDAVINRLLDEHDRKARK